MLKRKKAMAKSSAAERAEDGAMLTKTTANATTTDEGMTDDQTRRRMVVEANTDKSNTFGIVDTGKLTKVAHEGARGRRTRGAVTIDDEVLARTVEACLEPKRTLTYPADMGMFPMFSCFCWRRLTGALLTGSSEASQIAASRSMSCSSALDCPANLLSSARSWRVCKPSSKSAAASRPWPRSSCRYLTCREDDTTLALSSMRISTPI